MYTSWLTGIEGEAARADMYFSLKAELTAVDSLVVVVFCRGGEVMKYKCIHAPYSRLGHAQSHVKYPLTEYMLP
jgi:hypothetical protein